MYRIVYEKQAVKDIKNLKSARLDEKARKLIELIYCMIFFNGIEKMFKERLHVEIK